VLLSHQEIEQQIERLSHSMPRLLKDNPASEFWIEFLERADAIQDQVPLSRREWVTEKIYDVLAKYDILPPSGWIAGRKPRTARVYAFPSGLCLN
jgi:hypothetical protein